MENIDRNILYEQFQEKFPLEKLKDLPLDKYSNLDKDDSFCYWLERRTIKLGSVSGGSSYKFGIYKYKNRPKKDSHKIQSDDEYAWYSKYGKATAFEAYQYVIDAVVKIATSARNGNFEVIDDIKEFGDIIKWKIAFMYSNKQLIPIYKKEMLDKLALHFGLNNPKEKRISQIQRYLFSQKGNKDIFAFYDELLEYLNKSQLHQTWLYAPGENACKWEECLSEKKMFLGWDELGDLQEYVDKEDLEYKMKELYGDDSNYKNNILSTWDFAKEINVGDVIFAKKGRSCIIGRGIVVGEYGYDESREEFRHYREINWVNVGEWNVSETLAMKTLTNITKNAACVSELNKLINTEYKPNEAEHYWWLCGNPGIWSMKNWAVGEEQDYTIYNEDGNKRRIFKNFEAAKVGDIVVCYEARPTKQIVALAIVSKASDGEKIYFKKIENLASPVDFAAIKAVPELRSMEFLANPNGSFFKLSKDEYNVLNGLIRGEKIVKFYEKYTDDDFLNEVFISRDEFETLKELVELKKNVILQGAPGVGKTFSARRLAWAMLGEKNDNNITLIQFHQNYSYEDFVMGYKPAGNTFELQTGIFYDFCKRVAECPEEKFFFIIDEINRGNLSKIFGELLMLIEDDYRGEELTLAYRNERFSVPKNLFIIGMMNTADRSLALIDYALRRRFSFYSMRPGFDTEGFKNYLKAKNNSNLYELVNVIKELNKRISSDDSLGPGFEIGHSYLCHNDEITDMWLKIVVNYDIVPLLKEYWFDNIQEAERWENKLNNVLKDD